MSELLPWIGITALFMVWVYWPRIKKHNSKQSEVQRARKRSKAIHPSNRD